MTSDHHGVDECCPKPQNGPGALAGGRHRRILVLCALLLLVLCALSGFGREHAQTAFWRLAYASQLLGRDTQAMVLYEVARRAYPSSALAREAAIRQVGYLVRHKHTGDRSEALRRALTLAEWTYVRAPVGSAAQLHAARWVADILEKVGRPGEAVVFWDNHLKRVPTAAFSVEVTESRIHAYAEAKQTTQALREFHHLETLPPPPVLGPGSYSTAIESVAKILTLDRGSAKAIEFLHGVANRHPSRRLGKVARVYAARLSGDVPVLVGLLEDRSVRALVVSCLGDMGPAAKAALPRLRQLCQGETDAFDEWNAQDAVRRITHGNLPTSGTAERRKR